MGQGNELLSKIIGADIRKSEERVRVERKEL